MRDDSGLRGNGDSRGRSAARRKRIEENRQQSAGTDTRVHAMLAARRPNGLARRFAQFSFPRACVLAPRRCESDHSAQR